MKKTEPKLSKIRHQIHYKSETPKNTIYNWPATETFSCRHLKKKHFLRWLSLIKVCQWKNQSNTPKKGQNKTAQKRTHRCHKKTSTVKPSLIIQYRRKLDVFESKLKALHSFFIWPLNFKLYYIFFFYIMLFNLGLAFQMVWIECHWWVLCKWQSPLPYKLISLLSLMNL